MDLETGITVLSAIARLGELAIPEGASVAADPDRPTAEVWGALDALGTVLVAQTE